MTSSDGIRLNRFLARCGVGSRRSCEELILSGRVCINGNSPVRELSCRVDPERDEVLLDGKPLHWPEKWHYFALHKPLAVECSLKPVPGRTGVESFFPAGMPGLFTVGRLDFLSSGLLLLTNDGQFAQQFIRPAMRIEKEYEVVTKPAMTREMRDRFIAGLEVEGVWYQAISITPRDEKTVSIVLHEGKNREIRQVLSAFGLSIQRLHRIRIGSILLGSLKEGQTRPLMQSEIDEFAKEGCHESSH